MLNPLRDPQCESPVSYCENCWGEVFSHETMVFYNGRWLCPDCFQAAIEKMLRENVPALADAMQLDMKMV